MHAEIVINSEIYYSNRFMCSQHDRIQQSWFNPQFIYTKQICLIHLDIKLTPQPSAPINLMVTQSMTHKYMYNGMVAKWLIDIYVPFYSVIVFGPVSLTFFMILWSFVRFWLKVAWWRHQMETFSALLAICAGNSPVHGEFPAQRPVTRGFDVFFDLRRNKRSRKQS